MNYMKNILVYQKLNIDFMFWVYHTRLKRLLCMRFYYESVKVLHYDEKRGHYILHYGHEESSRMR